MPDERLPEIGFDAGSEIYDQARRSAKVEQLLRAIAQRIAINEKSPAEEIEDVIVERKHVMQAAQRLFESDPSWIASLHPGSGIFLSHATADEDVANEIEADLRNAGVKCFVAHLSIEAGSPWLDDIWLAIRTCRVFVLLASTDAVRSEWCLPEIGAAVVSKKTIISARLDSTELPAVLKPFQTTKARTKKQRSDLVQQLKRLCSI